MVDDVASEKKFSTQNGGGDSKKGDGVQSTKEDNKNEALVQVSLSILAGIVGGAWVNILGKDLCINVLTMAITSIVIYGIIASQDEKSDKKKLICLVIFTVIIAILAVALFCCIKRCLQN